MPVPLTTATRGPPLDSASGTALGSATTSMLRSSCIGSVDDRRTPRGAVASAKSPVLFSVGGRGEAPTVALDAAADELGARGDAELREDLAQVVVDRARAEEQPRRHLLVGGALGDEAHDLNLLRRELVDCARAARAGGLAARSQLDARALGPGGGAQTFKSVAGR